MRTARAASGGSSGHSSPSRIVVGQFFLEFRVADAQRDAANAAEPKSTEPKSTGVKKWDRNWIRTTEAAAITVVLATIASTVLSFLGR